MSKKDFPPTVRRVVTGHDQHGKSVVWKDHTQLPVRVCPPDTPAEARTVRVTELWQTSRVPANNADSKDIAETVTKTGALAALHQDSGAVFRIVDFPPGGDKSHRTSSVDFAVVLSGEICMELEPGDEIVLKTGDSLVQRGTVHTWINRTEEYARVMFVLVGAEAVMIKGAKVQDMEYGLDK